MFVYKPLTWYILFMWTQNFACSALINPVFDIYGSALATNTLTSEEQTTICKTGVKKYWEQFFYGGPLEN